MIEVPHNRLTHGVDEAEAVSAVVASGQRAAGPEVARLEDDLGSVVGRRHAATVGSGLGALKLALLGLGVGSGDEVVVPAYSCVALANAVLACRATPVIADVTRRTRVLDPDRAATAIGDGRRRSSRSTHSGVPRTIAGSANSGSP